MYEEVHERGIDLGQDRITIAGCRSNLEGETAITTNDLPAERARSEERVQLLDVVLRQDAALPQLLRHAPEERPQPQELRALSRRGVDGRESPSFEEGREPRRIALEEVDVGAATRPVEGVREFEGGRVDAAHFVTV